LTHTLMSAQRASVGSTEAAKDVVARFGRIDRMELASVMPRRLHRSGPKAHYRFDGHRQHLNRLARSADENEGSLAVGTRVGLTTPPQPCSYMQSAGWPRKCPQNNVVQGPYDGGANGGPLVAHEKRASNHVALVEVINGLCRLKLAIGDDPLPRDRLPAPKSSQGITRSHPRNAWNRGQDPSRVANPRS
jgi:hypothetical protein